jgi:formamidopyrimidine-DNA glycosylase
MPELPETETIARDLDATIAGLTIVGCEVTKGDILREVGADTLAERVCGAMVLRCWRRAKLVVVDLSTGDRLVVQPRFTGALLVDDGALPAEERRYSTLAIRLSDGRAVHYRDIRRLGTVSLMSPHRFEQYVSQLGIEPLDPELSAERLSGLLRGRRQAVKKVLMDQRVLAGVGNIYANEALWRAGIDPSREARSLSRAEAETLRGSLRSVLEESIAARGTSFRDYRDARGARGSFVEQLAVYGRGGLPCLRCGGKLIATHAIDARSTVFCARCQG